MQVLFCYSIQLNNSQIDIMVVGLSQHSRDTDLDLVVLCVCMWARLMFLRVTQYLHLDPRRNNHKPKFREML